MRPHKENRSKEEEKTRRSPLLQTMLEVETSPSSLGIWQPFFRLLASFGWAGAWLALRCFAWTTDADPSLFASFAPPQAAQHPVNVWMENKVKHRNGAEKKAQMAPHSLQLFNMQSNITASNRAFLIRHPDQTCA